MPELPEVEVVRRGVRPHVVGRRIVSEAVSGQRLRCFPSRRMLRETLRGRRFEAVERRAKYLLFVMDNGAVLVLHLGMTGRLGIFRADDTIARHDHLRLLLDNGMELRFNDQRRFGSVQLFASAKELNIFFAPLGPEPFSEQFSAPYLAAKGAKKNQPVKNFLMDGRVVTGIGNIYASEILFKAKIDPRTPAARLSPAKWKRIVESCREVLARAIEQGGSSIINFVDLSGNSGYFQNELLVYGRGDEPCAVCGKRVQRIVQAGRSTFFCNKCQR